jgi:hypothetical protein
MSGAELPTPSNDEEVERAATAPGAPLGGEDQALQGQ